MDITGHKFEPRDRLNEYGRMQPEELRPRTYKVTVTFINTSIASCSWAGVRVVSDTADVVRLDLRDGGTVKINRSTILFLTQYPEEPHN